MRILCRRCSKPIKPSPGRTFCVADHRVYSCPFEICAHCGEVGAISGVREAAFYFSLKEAQAHSPELKAEVEASRRRIAGDSAYFMRAVLRRVKGISVVHISALEWEKLYRYTIRMFERDEIPDLEGETAHLKPRPVGPYPMS